MIVAGFRACCTKITAYRIPNLSTIRPGYVSYPVNSYVKGYNKGYVSFIKD